ncbi:RluA family pseudouridine synthase [bacterium]|nr:RluA family pseudouridine synthase [bacterium]
MPDPSPTRRFHQTFRLRKRVEEKRLDQYLAAALSQFSRTQIVGFIRDGSIRLNGASAKPSHHVQRGDRIDLSVELPTGPLVEAEDVPLDVLFEDDCLLVVNKPPDMVVHPVRGSRGGTLVNALLAHTATLSSTYGELRAGIVHRLDRDTSGVIVTAKTDEAHVHVAAQFKARTVDKRYVAVTEGVPEFDSDLIDAPIDRNKRHHEAMIVHADGKASRTIYHVKRRFRNFAHVELELLTGRTHQIRVHLAHIGYPVVADMLYGRRQALYRSDLLDTPRTEDELPIIERQALHAQSIAFDHPTTGERLQFTAPLPHDITTLLDTLHELQG